MAAATRIGAFFALIAILFAAAYIAGAHFGPVTFVHGHSGGSGGSSGSGSTMHMGAVYMGSVHIQSVDAGSILPAGGRR